MVTCSPREKLLPLIVIGRFFAPWPPLAGVTEVIDGVLPVTVKHWVQDSTAPPGVVTTALYGPGAASVRSKMPVSVVPLTVVDVSLSRYETIWAAAGHPHTVLPTSYDELLRLTGGTPAEVA